MSDWRELKRLASMAHQSNEKWFTYKGMMAGSLRSADSADFRFIETANPEAILALIAENEKLRGALELLKNPLSILSISTKCMACGEYHEGLGNLPCPKMRPMSSVDAEQGNG